MNRYTATEADIRAERASAYRDGGDLGISHMFDALASGKDMETAVAYAKAMIAAAEKRMLDDTALRLGSKQREEMRAQWGVSLCGTMGDVGNLTLAR